ncbi:hypothetical protein L227DRAFT_16408 [Lentinus tigrinus ALCF2SS1-6]|uniref:Secreted protein n=1 Tax=Lentinus tigrinus ALCF2SS1-6 TaxID=1328759 RepID=A0A5C2SVR5_9APHY|nr:hypothetical protein L227DRAFT_16408 [Lentinus tigrinus ALCF2SS1-6]
MYWFLLYIIVAFLTCHRGSLGLLKREAPHACLCLRLRVSLVCGCFNVNVLCPRQASAAQGGYKWAAGACSAFIFWSLQPSAFV